MNITYHKIPGVALDVCTAEQKLAYNLAFRAHMTFADEWKKARDVSGVCSSDLLHQIIDFQMKTWKDYAENVKKAAKRYNVDAIRCCLNMGLADYLDHTFIATDYDQIGKAFPAAYLNK